MSRFEKFSNKPMENSRKSPYLPLSQKNFQTNQWKIPGNPRTCRYRKKKYENFPDSPPTPCAAIAKLLRNIVIFLSSFFAIAAQAVYSKSFYRSGSKNKIKKGNVGLTPNRPHLF